MQKKPTLEPATAGEIIVPIESERDIVSARLKGRELALEMGFSPGDATAIATVISELARNIFLYAKHGEIALKIATGTKGIGTMVIARDEGPGIPDIKRALQGGFSTSGGLGMGLMGVRRLMDEFEITSEVGRGTTVMVTKWKP